MAKNNAGADAKLLNAITTIGPRNLSEISRRIGVPVETVKYKVNKQLASRGLRIVAIPDLKKVGLMPYYAELDFADEWRPAMDPILQALHEHAYLTYYTGYLTSRRQAAYFATPVGSEYVLSEVLNEMARLEMVGEFRLMPIKWINYLSVHSKHYNLAKGEWDVDWSEVKPIEDKSMLDEPVDYRRPPERASFDLHDLILLKEMQLNPLTRISDISRRTGYNQKTLAYHYSSHVRKKRMIVKYVLNWSGTEYYVKSNTMIFLELVTDNPSVKYVEEFRRVVEAVPFTVSTRLMGNNEVVQSQAVLPLHHFNYMLKYLSDHLPMDQVRIRIRNPLLSAWFTIPVSLYNSYRGWWVVKTDELVSKLRALHRAWKEIKSLKP